MNRFSDEQKTAVEKAGIGALLTLKQIKIQRELCKQIAYCFDLETGEFIFRGIRIKITMKEVEHILGLPSQGEEIKEPPKIHVPSLFHKYKCKEGSNITHKTLKDYLMSNETYGDDFIRNFVLYTIGFYLCPTLQPHVKSEYLGLIDNIENIKNLNWTSLMTGLQNRLQRLKDLKLLKQHKWKDAKVNNWPVVECFQNSMQIDMYTANFKTLPIVPVFIAIFTNYTFILISRVILWTIMLKYMELWTGNTLSTFFTQVL
ncbi:hypothetical protein HU200_042561 [Digitaria exilis]|uniref:Aminotransferase-like plant mobile domain-containing protein n=1 Tax=Digitaria exilis TaxID=1010633 RepID=A0A835EEH1_9POAL|nr:hypothetical protein HU200_042561 [Digitaria exilis]